MLKGAAGMGMGCRDALDHSEKKAEWSLKWILPEDIHQIQQ
jgi:hypothetical protein